MPKIVLLTVFSHNFFWIIQTIVANRDLLGRHGLHLPSFDPGATLFPQHLRFWNKAATKQDYEGIMRIIEEGQNVLLFAIYPSLELQNELNAHLQNLSPEKFEIVNYSIFCRPALIYEDLYKHNYGAVSRENIQAVLKLIEKLPKFAEGLLSAYPAANVHFLADMSEFISCPESCKLMQTLFSMWGIGENIARPEPKLSDYFLNSATAVRLLNARLVRGNDWPKFDDSAFMKALLKYEGGQLPEPCAPLDDRKNFAASASCHEAQRKTEELCGVEPGSFDAPDWFTHTPPTGPELPLDRVKIDAFLRQLSQAELQCLAQRYKNDETFLSADQKAILDILAGYACQGSEANFNRLGESTERPLLTVLTMTHNHEKYIAECMDSVLAQKTSFPVQHIVLDHYSQDGTAAIVNEYATRYPSIHPVLLVQTGKWFSNVRELLGRCHSRYAALCDGDDYFINNNKLQMQVDFLEENPQCAMVFHPVLVTFEDGKKPGIFPAVADLPRGLKKYYYLSDLTRHNFIQTNSVVYRWRFPDGLPDWFNCEVCPGDWYWHILHAETGAIGFIKKIMSVYRRHPDALYCHSFIDSIEHRRIHGMAELKAYKIYNEHLKGVYFENFAKLAAGVFTDLTLLGAKDDDSRLLDLASFRFPEFSLYFIRNCLRPHAATQKRPE